MKTTHRVTWMWAGVFTATMLNLTAQAQDLVVPKGSSKSIPVPEGIRRVTVANPNVIDAKPTDDGRALIVHGIGQGASELIIERLQDTNLAYRVVVREDLAQLREQIKELLADVEGLEITTVGDKIVLKGNIITKSGYDKVSQVVFAYSGVVLNMTTFDRREMNKYVEAAILRDIGLDGITAKVTEDTVILEGIIYSEAERKRAIEKANLYVPNVRDLLQLHEVVIETDVEFVQVETNAGQDIGYNILKDLGISAQGSFAGATAGRPAGRWGVTANAAAKINALLSTGRGKVLVQQNVSVKSGAEGRTMVGGEIGVPIAGNVGGSLEKIQYGVILRMKPTLRGRDIIISDVTVEVSMPVAAGRNAYALSKNETTTTVMCKVGESVVLSGLVQTLGTFSKEKTPIVGDIPLLNLFFSEKTSTKVRKEVVLLLTPYVLVPEKAQQPPMGPERKRLLENSSTTP